MQDSGMRGHATALSLPADRGESAHDDMSTDRLCVDEFENASDEITCVTTAITPECPTEADAFAALEAVVQATIDALPHAGAYADPTEALYLSASHMLTAIVAGRGAIPLERFLAMIETITASESLRRRVSAVRRKRLAQGLADHLHRDPGDAEVRRAATLWSAIMRGYYTGIQYTPEVYLPRQDPDLHARASSLLAAIYYDVMGRPAPTMSDTGQRTGS